MSCKRPFNTYFVVAITVFLLSSPQNPIAILAAQAKANHGDVKADTAPHLYLKALKAEQALIAAKLRQETDRWTILKGLQQRGHASWMELRKQRLRKDKLAALHQAYQDFVAEIEPNLSRVIPADSTTTSRLGQLAFTELFVEVADDSPSKTYRDFEARCKQYRDAISQKAASVENLKRQYQSLNGNDPWKPRFQHRVAVAEQELHSLNARLQLTTHCLDSIEGSGESKLMLFNSRNRTASRSVDTIPESVKQSLLKHCQLHGELLAEITSIEKARLAKLKAMHRKEMVTQRDMNSMLNRVTNLESSVEQQNLVAQKLNLLLQTTESQLESSANVEVADSSSSGGVKNWQGVRNRFLAHEARVQVRTAQLEKEMLGQVLARLEEAAAQIDPSDSGETKFSNSLRVGQQVEMDYYRRKIRLADLHSQLATARIQTLNSQHAAQCYAVSLETKNQVTLLGWMTLLHPRTLTSSFLNSGNNSSDSNGQLSMHLNYGPWSNYPTQFLGLDSTYRPLKLIDFARPIQVSHRSSLLSPSHRSTSYFNRSMRKPLSNPYSNRLEYESVYSTKQRKSKTFERAYQYGIIKPEYRGLLNPGQTPWYFPGSPNNLRFR